VKHLPAIFALIVAAAGWFYIFYSRAASNLSIIEEATTNRLRVRLRRVGGFVMILLAIAFYLAFVALDRDKSIAFVSLMMLVMLLMCVIVALGLFDLRLTRKLRNRSRRQDPP
jgi:UDP-N-acetylmuramyl pentapeptide phosphotransferase/UDP-N-acetylglucosamine-1-phosphate transferase